MPSSHKKVKSQVSLQGSLDKPRISEASRRSFKKGLGKNVASSKSLRSNFLTEEEARELRGSSSLANVSEVAVQKPAERKSFKNYKGLDAKKSQE